MHANTITSVEWSRKEGEKGSKNKEKRLNKKKYKENEI